MAMDEFDRIARLRALLGQGGGDVLLGIGDDAAVLARFERNCVLTVDTAVEHVHFRAQFADWATLAARAFSAALSDLAAMGAQPKAALSALILPATFADDAFDSLQRGLAEASAGYGCPIVGGNLARGDALSITTTAIGEVAGVGLTRSGAEPEQAIYVTGVLGAAALGLALLERPAGSRHPAAAACIERWRSPRARIAEGRLLSAHATAAIDVSDGALQDLGHLCRASGVGAELWAEALPALPGFAALAHDMGLDPLRLALAGGEDYELVYTLPSGAPDSARALGTQIGRITAEPGMLRILDAHGGQLPTSASGYRHFAD